MKKGILVILCCMGVLLPVLPAHADDPGFGGEIILGGILATGRLSLLDAEEGDLRVNRLTQRGDQETYMVPLITGELNYTLTNGRTSFFVTDLDTDSGVAAGVRQHLGEIGRISAAGTFETHKVWQDPYVVGVSRSRTDETRYGLSFEFEEILGTPFWVASSIAAVEVDTDRIGNREETLRRDGFRSDHTLGYVIGLSENQLIIPMVGYARIDLDGEANSSDAVTLALGYEWGQGQWGIEATASVGLVDYREEHPIFNKERRATSLEASALIAYAEPFGWSRVSIYGLAAYSRVDENIDFFDQDLWTFGLGVGYEF